MAGPLGRSVRAVGLALRGRTDAAAADEPLRYAGSAGAVPLTGLAVGLALAVLAVLLRGGAWGVAVAVLAALVVLVAVGSWCAASAYPHLLDEERLLARRGAAAWHQVPLPAVAQVRREDRAWGASGVLVTGTPGALDLVYALRGRTQLTVLLGAPRDVGLRPEAGQPRLVAAVHLAVDDPAAALAAFERALGPGAPVVGG